MVVPGGEPLITSGGPAEGVTVYMVSASPPLVAGTVQLTVADRFPAVAFTAKGAEGAVYACTRRIRW